MAYLGYLGAWGVFSGTSASAPAWAAIIALLNQANGEPVGFVTPRIYDLGHRELREAFHDITMGNNSDTDGQFGVDGFLAMHGYDLTTGVGSPDVSEFIEAMVDR